MSGQIHQYVDFVALDAVCETVVGPLRYVAPEVRRPFESLRDIVAGRRVGVAHDVELRLVAVFKNRPVGVGRRSSLEFGRHISHYKLAIWIAVDRPKGRSAFRLSRSDRPPPVGPGGLVMNDVSFRAEVEREDAIGERAFMTGSNGKGFLELGDRGIGIRLKGVALSKLDKTLDRQRIDG